MSKWDGLNRRKFPRVNYPCLVVIKNGEKDRDAILAHTENVGVGGICVILKQNIPMFSTVDIELDLLDLGNHIQCPGKVVWNVQRRPDSGKKPLFYDIGLEFNGLSDQDYARLQNIVDRLVKLRKETPYI
jgi:Tfp pilus assembly protein PilZ